MKNLTPLVTPHEIDQFVLALWKTDEFRSEHLRTDSLVHKAVERFGRLPRLFADMSDDQIETAHFSSWWSVISRRYGYDNPVVHDLYYLHEMMHAATLAYVPDMSFEPFRRKMDDNELETSLGTEILIYFEIPGLRAKSFPHEIYADRFLKDPAFQDQMKNDREGAVAFLREQRREVMYGRRPEELDPVEASIQLYATQNTQWQMVWKLRYREIETNMHRIQQMARIGKRKEAIQAQIDWLGDSAHTDGSDVPYRREAEAFSAIYTTNKKYYKKMVDSLSLRPVVPQMPAPAGQKPQS